jgi:hypothetical protein
MPTRAEDRAGGYAGAPPVGEHWKVLVNCSGLSRLAVDLGEHHHLDRRQQLLLRPLHHDLGLSETGVMTDDWIRAAARPALAGQERFAGIDASVIDFWRFALSDLRMNNARGYLAEFLVARAVGATGPRVEWDTYDVLSPDGIRIEVKSSAYLQLWDQRQLSRIVFAGLRGHILDPHASARVSTEATFNADVYVFAVQTAQSHDAYDPLDVGQWEFYALSRREVEERGARSIGLRSLRVLAGAPTPYDGLADSIRAATTR